MLDTTPAAFEFEDVVDVSVSSKIVSNGIQVTDIAGSTLEFVEGGKHEIFNDTNCAAFSPTPWLDQPRSVQ